MLVNLESQYPLQVRKDKWVGRLQDEVGKQVEGEAKGVGGRGGKGCKWERRRRVQVGEEMKGAGGRGGEGCRWERRRKVQVGEEVKVQVGEEAKGADGRGGEGAGGRGGEGCRWERRRRVQVGEDREQGLRGTQVHTFNTSKRTE
ncbi:hypothetical protein Pcinc_031327 [Petrolisthes cinctipes]|uniref:Uncharacterized protein n=1 Tax=Petrolisthes cinctipes TaxID=88211 RepID=A0AAE1EWC5_PETCI|nr:hypothetical protein Pcinc_031327 [Petrolisthes cinctipes]